MTRKEVYEKIKSMNLQDEVKEVFGKNFTNVNTADLELIVDRNKKPKTVSLINIKVFDKADKLIEVLEKKRILLKSEVDYINK